MRILILLAVALLLAACTHAPPRNPMASWVPSPNHGPRQPILIVQGELDTQVQPYHADKLAELARARKGDKVPVEVVKVPGVNHLLVPAKTGDVSEYATLGSDAKVSPQVTSAIATFLAKVMTD